MQLNKDIATDNLRKNEFWSIRSSGYDKLKWVTEDKYLNIFLEAGNFGPEDVVLDVGTGTGIIAQALADRVQHIWGLDKSEDMLDRAAAQKKDNQSFILGSASMLPFEDCFFSKATARMVFHHLLDETEEAIRECHRVLKPGGMMVLSEGTPPNRSVEDFYRNMFALKEERLTFFDEDLVDLMNHGGFKDIDITTYWMRQVSIKNWLENSGLDHGIQKIIFDMHRDLHPEGKEAYAMRETEDDIAIDMKFLVLTGKK